MDSDDNVVKAGGGSGLSGSGQLWGKMGDIHNGVCNKNVFK